MLKRCVISVRTGFFRDIAPGAEEGRGTYVLAGHFLVVLMIETGKEGSESETNLVLPATSCPLAG